MPKVLDIKEENGNKGLLFWCEGCNTNHRVYISGTGVPIWTFNGDYDKPTIRASVLVRGHLGKDKNDNDNYGVCHSFVTDGKIQYLNDCTHNLKGKTIELTEYDL